MWMLAACSTPPIAGPAQPTDPACQTLPTTALGTQSYPLTTTEDFDFDALGKAVFSDFDNIVAADQDGVVELVAPGTEDPRGVQVQGDGNLVVVFQDQGLVASIDRATGSTAPLISSLSGPNGLELGPDGEVYVTETGFADGAGTVSRFDPETGDRTVLGDGFGFPNGVVFDAGRGRLYVADADVGVFVLDSSAGGFGPPTLILDLPGDRDLYDALEVDSCGNLYVVDYGVGQLFRVDPQTQEVTSLFQAAAPPYGFVGARWGSDRGGWRRDVLYLSNRSELVGVEVGVRGQDQPVDRVR
jgi:sugar lactone lactonase YvrE